MTEAEIERRMWIMAIGLSWSLPIVSLVLFLNEAAPTTDVPAFTRRLLNPLRDRFGSKDEARGICVLYERCT